MNKPFVSSLDKLGHFGGVQCAYCGWKAEDVWDDSPEGFLDSDGECVCEACFEEFEKEESK
jgi:hypothetical protein